MNILVLGGTGFVGQALCERLVAAGHRVTVPTRRAANARSVQALPLVTVVEANVHEPQALSQLVAGHDAVVNLIAILQGDESAFERVHVVFAQALAAACQAAGTHHLLHVSALGVSANAPSRYLRSKYRSEQALLSAGLPQLTIVRPSVIFGASDRFTNLFARLQSLFPVMPLACADAKLQPVWVGDVAEFLTQSILSRGSMGMKSYHKNSNQGRHLMAEAAGPQIYTLREIVAFCGEQAGCSRPILALPNAMGQLQALAMELMPGEPLMSRDNLASLKVPNVASGQLPNLPDFGITPASLASIGPTYLGQRGPRSQLNRYRKGS